MESWSVKERIRSAPGNGGCGSAIVFVLAPEAYEGLLFIQYQKEASFIDDAVFKEPLKKPISGKLKRIYNNESKAQEVAGDGSHS